MKYPFISFSLALFLALLLLIFSYFVFFKKDETNSLPIEVGFVEYNVNQNTIKSSTKDETGNLTKENNNAKKVDNLTSSDRIATIIDNPLPQIPEYLRHEAFVSKIIARFYISKDGNVKVELIQPSSNQHLNILLLNSLKKWKFSPSTQKGVEIDSIRDIEVNFKVE